MGALNAASWPGSDMGAKINNAYASSTNGDVIWVATGTWNFSTNIVMGTADKNVLLQCSPGAVLNFTGTGNIITVNSLNVHFFDYGVTGCKITGPSRAGSVVAIFLGGSNGAEGAVVSYNTISGVGTAVKFGDNAWNISLSHNTFNNNGKNIFFPDGTTNSGENIRIDGGSMSNDYSPAVNPYHLKCVEDASNSFTSINITDVSFDLCQVAITATSGLANVNVSGGHIEPPGNVTPAYYFFTVAQAQVATSKNNLSISNLTMLQGASATTSLPNALVHCDGICRFVNVTAEVGGRPTPNFVDGSGTIYSVNFDYNLWWNGSANVPAVTSFFNGSPLKVSSIENSTGTQYSMDQSGNVLFNSVSTTLPYSNGTSTGISQSCSGIYFPSTSTVSGGIVTGNTCFYSNYYSVVSNPNATGQSPTANVTLLWGLPVTIPVQFNRIVYDINTLDAATSSKADIGIYQVVGSQLNLIANIGATTTLSTGVKTASTTQGMVTLSPDQKYYVGITANSSTMKWSAGVSTYTFVSNSAQASSTAGGLPSTSTIPTDVWTNGSLPSVMLYR